MQVGKTDVLGNSKTCVLECSAEDRIESNDCVRPVTSSPFRHSPGILVNSYLGAANVGDNA